MAATEEPQLSPVPESLLPTGFASPAQDYFSGRIDLNKALIPNPSSTVLMKVRDNAMNLDGICTGDEILIDRAGTPHHGSVVVATVDGGEILIRRLRQTNGRAWLEASNPNVPPTEISDGTDLQILGVATRTLHRL
ncbi:LexA family protein (plasmid) [Arthrobacter sp. G.S.26]|uniref:LexA family protein n=1 Tax=Arthrobacter sp. G.S.26 TaxID=3433706 RepID=UPI003D76E67E